MEQLSLFYSLKFKPPAVIAFFGGGGKTSLMRVLAEEMALSDHKVLLTTTTKIYPYRGMPHFYLEENRDMIKELKKHFSSHNLAVIGYPPSPDGKIRGIDNDYIKIIFETLQVSVLVEADGSKGKPIKGFADYEPVIPDCSDLLIPVIGADALGAEINNKTVHRPELLRVITGSKGSKPASLDEADFAKVYCRMTLIGKNQASKAKTIYVLNKYDLLNAPSKAHSIAKLMVNYNCRGRFLVTETLGANPVKMNLRLDNNQEAVSVSCIILAAGQSSRMGKDKLSLYFRDSTILGETVKQVSNAGFDELILVTKPNSHWKDILRNYDIKIVENPAYMEGQATSLIAGLRKVDPCTQGILFALGDQPLIKSSTYKSLVKTYRNNLKPVTYPLYREKRGNPVIIDRSIWPELLNLKGDQGGRNLIKKLEPGSLNPVDTADAAVLLDIDTAEDYKMHK
ncbi:MAG: selenium cofactor biosynthesis protein YqeC [Dethiobacteria bacterium]